MGLIAIPTSRVVVRTNCNNTHKALGMVSAHSMCSVSAGAKTFMKRYKRGWGAPELSVYKGIQSLLTGPYFPSKSLPAISRGLQEYFPWHSRNCPLTFSCSEPCVHTPSHRPCDFPGPSTSPLSQRSHTGSLHVLCGSQGIFGWTARCFKTI